MDVYGQRGRPALSACRMSNRRKTGGFTMVELIVTLVLIGIVAAVAIPRFVGRDAFDARGYSDQFVGAFQYARQQAIAQRRTVCVAVAANGTVTLTRALVFEGVCGPALVDPARGAAFVLTAPKDGVAVAARAGTALPLTLSFDALGRPNAAAGVRIAGDIDRCMQVEATTGYVHFTACP